jgi:hypothetical protein
MQNYITNVTYLMISSRQGLGSPVEIVCERWNRTCDWRLAADGLVLSWDDIFVFKYVYK